MIVDEIHALAPTKRGAHLALSLERLEHLVRSAGRDPVPGRAAVVQRIGLSATQRPLEVVAGYLGGNTVAPGAAADTRPVPRPVRIVDAGIRKELDLQVIVPVEDLGALGEVVDGPASGPAAAGPVRRSIWPSMHPVLLGLVQEHHSTLVFVNARRLAERLASRLNELAAEQAADVPGTEATPPPVAYSGAESMGLSAADVGGELVKAHHGSLSRERRLQIEDELKRGTLRGLVATSSLELGIDMGAVDLVVQVASPGSVASGLQRIGRAGHQVGAPSRGRIFPKHRADLLEAAVVVQRMQDGLIEPTSVPANPLDVLAQQLVASCALDDWSVQDLFDLVRGAANFSDLSREVFHATLDLLAGPLPVRGVLRAASPVGVGPHRGHRPGPGRGPAPGRHLGRHHPGPGPVRGVPPRRHPGGRAGRGDGLRVPRGGDVPARGLHLAHRGHHLRAGGGHPGAGPARQDAVLARGRPGPGRGAGPGPGGVRAGGAVDAPGGGRRPAA